MIGANFLTVLSYDFWQEYYGGDRAIVGQAILVNGNSLTIVGVAPAGFRGTTLGAQPALYAPISRRAAITTWRPAFDNRRRYWVYVFGCLKPGLSIEQASTQLNVTYKPILADVEVPLQEGMSDATMKLFKAKSLVLAP
ncbi:ABC transporter permease, partial [Gemmatimonas sp.]|uniref:ABC transporter permease n=1 Tax=Gemmatimonas sp. TaxID=1962908 RepID=UPI00356A3615